MAPLLGDAPLIAYIAALFFGFGDSVFNTQCMAIIGRMFHGVHCIRAFTVFNLFQNLGSAGGFFYAIPLPMHGPSGTLGQVCGVCIASQAHRHTHTQHTRVRTHE
eukprot:m.107880 g.107880  ORF g.107880 m.107880 type:complete len:105 (+) comp14259_c0_seq3:74-388(+)